MIVVSLDGRAVEWTWRHFQAIADFFHGCAAFCEFCAQGKNALAFLETEPSQIGERGGFFRERRKNNGGQDAVAPIVGARDRWRQWAETREARNDPAGRGGALAITEGGVGT